MFNLLCIPLTAVSDFTKINLDFSKVCWQWVTDNPIENFPSTFNNIVYSTLLKHSKVYQEIKPNKFINKFRKKRKIATRKIHKYKKATLYSNCNEAKLAALNEKITTLKNKKAESFFDERTEITGL